MKQVPVTLTQMLSAREERAERQQHLLSQYSLPIISFTMNIAGEIKNSSLITAAFNYGCERLEASLGKPLYKNINSGITGPEAMYVYDKPGTELKEQCVLIEEEVEIGRLFDLDVISPKGLKLERGTQRRCIVCGGPVTICSRSRSHGLEAIKSATDERLKAFACEKIADMAVEALIEEVNTTPKPGLVDLNDNGAHSDLYPELFYKSALCLREYFSACVKCGMTPQGPDLQALQSLGIEAEKKMFSETDGVNTHKGAIYILGLICAAAGECIEEGGDIFAVVSSIAGALSSYDEGSNGEKARKSVKDCGARAEAVNGLPSAREGLLSLNKSEGAEIALLRILLVCKDSNLIYRGGPEAIDYARSEAKKVLEAKSEERPELLSRMNHGFIERNLSPGGCADMLSAAILIKKLADNGFI